MASQAVSGLAVLLLLGPSVIVGDNSISGRYTVSPGPFYPTVGPAAAPSNTQSDYSGLDSPINSYGQPSTETQHSPTNSYGLPSTETLRSPINSYGQPSTEAQHSPTNTYGLPSTETLRSPTNSYGLPETVRSPTNSYSFPGPGAVHQANSFSLPEVEEEHQFLQYERSPNYFPQYQQARRPGLASVFGGPPPVFPYNDPSLLALPPPLAALTIPFKFLYSVIEPIIVLVFGIGAFLLVKNLLLPHLGHWYRSLDLDFEEEERSLAKEVVAKTVLKAITKGVCMERLACQMGKKAKDYTLTNAVLKALEGSSVDSLQLATIFRHAVSGRIDSCEPYTCTGRPVDDKKNLVPKKSQPSPNEIPK